MKYGILLTAAALLLAGCAGDAKQDAALTTPATQGRMEQLAKPAAAVATGAHQPGLHMEVDVMGSTATVRFLLDHFKLSPENYNKEHVPGEGHIHLFVDGSLTKIPVKETTYTLTGLTPGKHELKAALHTNNHQPYNVESITDFQIAK